MGLVPTIQVWYFIKFQLLDTQDVDKKIKHFPKMGIFAICDLNIFFKNHALSLLYHYALTSSKKLEESNGPSLRESKSQIQKINKILRVILGL